MRISTSYLFDTFARDIANASNKVYSTQQQVTTGKRINKPSDDPFGTKLVLSQTAIKSALTQYNANLTTAKNTLDFSDNALGQVQDLMNTANSLALQGANAATDDASRQAMAQQVEQIQSQLVSLANSRGANGEFVFAGTKNDSAPFTLSGTTLTYSGNAGSITIESSPTSTLVVNTQGQQLFTNAYQALEDLKNNLLGNNATALSGTTLTEISNSQDAFNFARGAIGAKLQSVTNLTDENNRRSDELTTSISNTQDVDIATALTQYQLAQTAYQAALTVAGQGYKLSLMDYLK